MTDPPPLRIDERRDPRTTSAGGAGRAAGAAHTLRRELRQRRFALAVRRNLGRALTPPAATAFAAFGQGSVIVPPARVGCPHRIWIGRDTILLEQAWLSVEEQHATTPPRLVIGDRVRFGPRASIACIGEVVIGDDVMTSDNVFIADCFHGYEDPDTPVLRQPMSEPEPVVVQAGAYLGAGSILLPGITVGERAYVGEGAVVTRDVPSRTVVLGNPARIVRHYDEHAAAWVTAAQP